MQSAAGGDRTKMIILEGSGCGPILENVNAVQSVVTRVYGR